MGSKERSTAYPSISLEVAVTLIEKVRDGLGSGDVTREQIAPVIGHEKVTGPASSKIAALAHYGLLDKGKGTYRISQLAVRILSPTSDQEKTEALEEAARRPALFSSIYDRYESDGRLPAAIEAIMHREYGVTLEASKTARANLVASLAYAGLLIGETLAFKADRNNEGVVANSDSSGTGSESSAETKVSNSAGPITRQSYELPLQYGPATLILPSKLTAKDFSALEAMVALVKHFVSDVRPSDDSGKLQEG